MVRTVFAGTKSNKYESPFNRQIEESVNYLLFEKSFSCLPFERRSFDLDSVAVNPYLLAYGFFNLHGYILKKYCHM